MICGGSIARRKQASAINAAAILSQKTEFFLYMAGATMSMMSCDTAAADTIMSISIPSGITAAFGLQKMPPPEFLGNYMGFLSKLPLNDYGFNWLLPAICGFVIATIISAVGKVGKTRGDA